MKGLSCMIGVWGVGLLKSLSETALTTQNQPLRPVLKHGPRSLSWMRVRWCQTKVRNESKSCDH